MNVGIINNENKSKNINYLIDDEKKLFDDIMKDVEVEMEAEMKAEIGYNNLYNAIENAPPTTICHTSSKKIIDASYFNFDNYMLLVVCGLHKIIDFGFQDFFILQETIDLIKQGYRHYYSHDIRDIFKYPQRDKPWLVLYKDLALAAIGRYAILAVFYEMLINRYINPDLKVINMDFIEEVEETDFFNPSTDFIKLFNLRFKKGMLRVSYPLEFTKFNILLEYRDLRLLLNLEYVNSEIKKVFLKYDKHCFFEFSRLHGVTSGRVGLEHHKLLFYSEIRRYLVNKLLGRNEVPMYKKKIMRKDRLYNTKKEDKLLYIIANDKKKYFSLNNSKLINDWLYRQIYIFLSDLEELVKDLY